MKEQWCRWWIHRNFYTPGQKRCNQIYSANGPGRNYIAGQGLLFKE